MKRARFVGTSLDVIREFPKSAQKEIGYQIGRVQDGEDPEDWKPLKVVGPGAREIRVRDETGAYRVIYVASFADVVYVLHAFQKKTQATPQHHLELAARRYAQIARQ